MGVRGRLALLNFWSNTQINCRPFFFRDLVRSNLEITTIDLRADILTPFVKQYDVYVSGFFNE